MKDNLFNYVEKFIKCGQIQDEAMFTGEYKSSNKTLKITENIFELAKESDDREKFYLEILDVSNSPSALITCCAHMMKLDIKPNLARKKLEEIRDDEKYHPIFSFNAKMFLSEWDKGNIKKVVVEE